MMTQAILLAEVCRYFIGFLLICAGVAKFNNFAQFKENLVGSMGVKQVFADVIAPTVVLLEMLLAVIVLAFFSLHHVAMAAAFVMFLMFTAFIAYKFLKEGIVKCSCFGEASRSVSVYDLLRNGLIMLGIFLYLACAQEVPIYATIGVEAIMVGLALILTIIAIEFHEIIKLIFGNA